MLRRAKSVDIPFMVKGYEIGLRDGNFSESKMQINAFFANTTTHKNVHSYIYENNGSICAYAILRKKDAARHEIMMMFVDPAQQGNGIGKKFLASLLAGPMKDSPILCSTTQPASTRMMGLLKSAGFQRKVEAADGVYWERSNGPTAAPAPTAAAGPTAVAQPLPGIAPPPRLALPMAGMIIPPTENEVDGTALEQATQVSHRLPPGYRPAPPPPSTPTVIDGVATEARGEEDAGGEHSVPDAPPVPPAPMVEASSDPAAEPITAAPEALPAVIAPVASPEQPPEPLPAETPVQEPANPLPKPPIDFSSKAKALGYESRQQRAKQLAKELFETLRGNNAELESETVPAVSSSDTLPAVDSSEEDIPLLATLNIVREKMGSLPGVKLPPLDRYYLMEMNKKDLENMNVVELAALSAQLIKLARDQLAEIDRLKVSAKRRK